jgi:hypothetical protein
MTIVAIADDGMRIDVSKVGVGEWRIVGLLPHVGVFPIVKFEVERRLERADVVKYEREE